MSRLKNEEQRAKARERQRRYLARKRSHPQPYRDR
jgi:hypothetical protein